MHLCHVGTVRPNSDWAGGRWTDSLLNNRSARKPATFVDAADPPFCNQPVMSMSNKIIGHFRVQLCLCFKTSLSAKPFLWKWLICMKMKLHAELIFIWKVSNLDSFWNRDTRELGNGLLGMFKMHKGKADSLFFPECPTTSSSLSSLNP